MIAGFIGQLIAYPVLGRHGRRMLWALLAIAIGAGQAAGFAIVRHSGAASPDSNLVATAPILGIVGGMLTALARAWGSGLVRTLLGIVVLALVVAGVILLVLKTAP